MHDRPVQLRAVVQGEYPHAQRAEEQQDRRDLHGHDEARRRRQHTPHTSEPTACPPMNATR
jgi:hypothetical protein